MAYWPYHRGDSGWHMISSPYGGGARYFWNGDGPLWVKGEALST